MMPNPPFHDDETDSHPPILPTLPTRRYLVVPANQDADDDLPDAPVWTWRRIITLAITLFVIFAFLTVNYLPGFLAMYQNAERLALPTPTTLPHF